jgi:hypothetical protein
MNTFRWLLILPVIIFGWYVGIFSAIAIYKSNEWLCPTQYIVSGMCYAPWSSFIEEFSVTFGSVISASLIVLLPSLVAPSRHVVVAFATYIFGLLCSSYWLVHGSREPVAWAAIGGAITLWLIIRSNSSFS